MNLNCLVILNIFLPFEDLFDTNITDEKAHIFCSAVPSLQSLHTNGHSIASLDLLRGCGDKATQDNLIELYLDMEGEDFRGDLLNYLEHSGCRLTTLELKKMSLPIDISQLTRLCPHLKRLKVALSRY